MSSSRLGLGDLPESVVDRVIALLDQRDVLQLALTTFRYYQPCTTKLYRKILVQENVLLESSSSCRVTNFYNSEVTAICGFENSTIPASKHSSLVSSRIQVLVQSLTVNPLLAHCIEEISVGPISASEELAGSLQQLFGIVKQSTSITKVYIEDTKLRAMFYGDFSALPPLLTNLDLIGLDINPEFPPSRLGSLSKSSTFFSELAIDSIADLGVLRCTDTKKWVLKNITIGSLPRIAGATEWKISQTGKAQALATLNTIRLHLVHEEEIEDIFSHYYNEIVGLVSWNNIRNLHIHVGCNNAKCDQKCLATVLDMISLRMLQKTGSGGDTAPYILKNLSFVHEKHPHHHPFRPETHQRDVVWDLAIFGFLTNVFRLGNGGRTQLNKLTIVNNGALSGCYEDGMEGNYLLRLKLYTRTLPDLLSNNLQPVKLSLPSLFTTLANYEQPMNNLLWNGCKCSHCQIHLQRVDEFLMTHKYYSPNEGYWKDLTTCQFMVAIGDKLSSQVSLRDSFYSESRWNIHQNRYGIPFLCLQHKTVDEGEFENDNEEDDDEEVEFFDANEQTHGCNSQIKFRDLSICISHYLRDILLKMLNLNRGNAEEIELGGEFENDGGSSTQIFHELDINGILFSTGKEKNGTNWLTCISY